MPKGMGYGDKVDASKIRTPFVKADMKGGPKKGGTKKSGGKKY